MNDEIIAEIKQRILMFIIDNPQALANRTITGLQHQFETAALIGASVACEKMMKLYAESPDDGSISLIE